MNSKIFGYIVTVLLIGAMIIFIVKSNMDQKTPIQSGDEQGEQVGLEQGTKPPDFELETLDGQQVKLSDLKGKKVMLNFWASWCGPCKIEMPHMESYYQKYSESGEIEIIAVNLTSQERKGLSGVENFVKENELTFPIPLDKDGEIMDMYRILAIPTSYFLNTDGTIEIEHRGPMDEKSLKKIFDQLN